tara:strand:+ start:700 stop:1080 length:381 start_codon:yes stop_codon:yes gene_type:complete
MKTISYDQVINFHSKLISKTGGSDGVKDSGLIKSALERHRATFGGEDLYPTIVNKISVTTTSLVRNHGFIDGNKRIGVSVMLLLLKLNNINIEYSQPELIELGLNLASNNIDEKDVETWINEHSSL